MLKSLLLSSVRPMYAPDDEKSAADKEREKIKTNTPEEKVEEKEEDVDDKVDEKNEGKEGDEKEEEVEEVEEEDKDNEPKELTVEQKTIKKLEKAVERLQRRVGKTTGERDTIRTELAEAKKALDTKVKEGEQPLTEEEVTRRAKDLADQTLTAREFENAQERLIEGATKIDKKFMAKIKDLADEVAPLPPFFIGALDDLDNGGAVLNYLTDNADEYEDLLKKKGATRIIKGLVEISNKLIEEAKPKIQKISKVPDPPAKDMKGNQGSPSVLTGKEDMDTYVRIRNEQVEARRKLRASR